MKDLFRSFARARPAQTRRVIDWDVTVVSRAFASGQFKDWHSLSDRELTLKTVFLVALASGKRVSELHALSKEVKWTSDNGKLGALLSLLVSFVSKTHLSSSGVGAFKPFTIPALDSLVDSRGSPDLLPCPVRCLKYYVARTEKYRKPSQSILFISFQRRMAKDLAKSSIASYVKQAIIMAYELTSASRPLSNLVVQPHSVRHVAASLAALRCSSLEELLSAGCWTTPDVFLAYYATNFSTDSITNLSRLGGIVAAQTVVA